MSTSTGESIMAAVVGELNRQPLPTGAPAFTRASVYGIGDPASPIAQVVELNETATDIERGNNLFVVRELFFDVELSFIQKDGGTIAVQTSVDIAYVHAVSRLTPFTATGKAMKIDEIGSTYTYDHATRQMMRRTVHFKAKFQTRADDPTVKA